MVFRGGGEIPALGLESQSAGSCCPPWRRGGRDSSGRRASAGRRVCVDAASGFDAGAELAVRTESRGPGIVCGGDLGKTAGCRKVNVNTAPFRAREKGPPTRPP